MAQKKFDIEDGIPCPEKSVINSKWADVPLRTMVPGQSVLLDRCKEITSNKKFKRVYSTLYAFMRSRGHDTQKYKISMIPSSESGKMDIRVWRVNEPTNGQ